MLRRNILCLILLPALLSAPLPAFADTSDMSTPDSSLVRMITANPGRKMTLHLYNGEMLNGIVAVVEDGVEVKSKRDKVRRFIRWEQIQQLKIEVKRSGINRAVVIGSWITCAAAVVLVAVLFLHGY